MCEAPCAVMPFLWSLSRREGSNVFLDGSNFLADEQDAVPDLFLQFDPVGGEIGKPLPVGDVPEAVFAGVEPGPGDPPTVAFVAHRDRVGLPAGKVPGEGDLRGAGAVEPELDFSV